MKKLMLLLLFLGWWNQWHHRVISTVHFYSYHFVATPYNYPTFPLVLLSPELYGRIVIDIESEPCRVGSSRLVYWIGSSLRLSWFWFVFFKEWEVACWVVVRNRGSGNSRSRPSDRLRSSSCSSSASPSHSSRYWVAGRVSRDGPARVVLRICYLSQGSLNSFSFSPSLSVINN